MTEDESRSRFPRVSMRRGIFLLLATNLGGWLLFDGGRALLKGDYVRPQSGSHAGQLGPWSFIVESCGLDPMSLTIKLLHVVSGLVWLTLLVLVLRASPIARHFIWLAVICGLWYLPFGTGIAVACAILYLGDPDRDARTLS